jgi:hypothetical protein
MMARPYPTKNAALLDSFLEHKIENERLTKRIADLKKEEAEEAENQQRNWLKRQEGGQDSLPLVAENPQPTPTTNTDSETPGSASLNSTQSNDYIAMPPPAKPGTSNTALTRQNLDEANASAKPDSINDKMARYEGATHIETIEMLTGLRYRDGERSQGISTGDASPALIRGDAGIAIPADKDLRGGQGDKKKKLKVADEFVCTDCGMLSAVVDCLAFVRMDVDSSKAPSIHPNGARDRLVPRHSAMRAVYGGRRRRRSEIIAATKLALRRRQARQADRCHRWDRNNRRRGCLCQEALGRDGVDYVDEDRSWVERLSSSG